MNFSSDYGGREQEIADLFTQTFTASEGEEEGRLIGDLAQNLLSSTPADDLIVFLASRDTTLLGCIIFSRMRYAQDQRRVFILSPVAVRTDHQGQGVGQNLLHHGLQAIRDVGVDVALTYGDPRYYAKVGFQQISTQIAAPPHVLSHAAGWLGQSLTDQPLTPLLGSSQCVSALDDPAYW
jgi:predicted N-acetyltransferase YhbS